jgi:hypothetical protein
MPYKFGKKPENKLRACLAFSNFTNMGGITFPPARAWERNIVLGMLGNDKIGLCVIAAIKHLRMTQRSVAQAGNPLLVTTEEAIADYKAITGYDGTPATDNGTDIGTAVDWYKAKGEIVAEANVDLQNIDMVKACINTFGGLPIGFRVPQSMVDQLNAGVDPTFEFFPNDKYSGEDHCVNIVGYGKDGFTVDSWGNIYRAPWDFFFAYVDTVKLLVTPDWIKANGKSPSGMDMVGLLAATATMGRK